jgi:hypothetical protein
MITWLLIVFFVFIALVGFICNMMLDILNVLEKINDKNKKEKINE